MNPSCRTSGIGRITRLLVVPALCVFMASCADERLTGPSRVPPDAMHTIDVQEAALQIDVFYAGQPLHQVPVTSSPCLIVTLDGTEQVPFCSSLFFVRGLVPGDHTIAVRTADGFEVMAPATVSIAAGQTAGLEVDIGPWYGLVSGRLTVNGEPAQGGFMVCTTPDRCTEYFDANGTFTVFAMPGSGTGTVANTTSWRVAASFEWTAAAGATRDVGSIAVYESALRIDVFYAGQPLHQVPATSSPCLIVTLDGTEQAPFCSSLFSVRGLIPGDHTVAVRMVDGFEVMAPSTVSMAPGQTFGLEVDVGPWYGLVSGQLTVNGEPAQGGFVVCTTADHCTWYFDGNGTFTVFAKPGSGTGTVTNTTTGRVAASFEWTAVAGATRDAGSIAVEEAALRIDVFYAGQPLHQVPTTSSPCLIVTLDGTEQAPFCSSLFFVRGLVPGDHTIAVRTADGLEVMAPSTVSIAPGQTAGLEVDIGPWYGLVSGRLTVNGEPAQGGFVVCTTAELCTWYFDGNGTFTMFAKPGSGTGTVASTVNGRVAATFGYVAQAGRTTLVGTVEGGASGYTPAGTGIVVKPYDPETSTTPATLQFTTVTVAGNTQVRPGANGPPPPNGTRPGSPTTFYNIETTATFTGTVLVCINYDDAAFGNENRLKLYHAPDGSAWTDVTTTRDAAANVVCGTVTSFSPFLVAETNVAPVVESVIIQNAVVPVGAAVGVRASFTDANPRDRHTATVLWDDGTSSAGAVAEAAGSGTVTASHAYGTAGVYTIGVRVSDDPLAGERVSTSDLPAYAVVYDPSAGFVTGGGWISSPAGACRLGGCAESTTGRASFGFVARYRPGAAAPTGNTEFQFRAGGLEFRSGGHDWLVVAGARAQFKGWGQINGRGEYGFLLTAIDGALLPGGGPDRFRIKVWDRSTGTVVYDNRMGVEEDSDASTELSGGGIVIHR